MTPQELKNSILQLAIQGKLVEQRPEEGTGEELYQQIQAEKQRLIKEGKIKKEKPLPEISEDEIPFDIPESWKWVRLQHVADINGGYAFKSTNYTSNGVRVVRISDFNEDGFINDNIVRHAYDDSLSQYLLEEKSILLCMTGGTVGKSLFVRYLQEKMMVNQRVATIKVHKVLPEYIYLIILSPLTQSVIQHSKNSTNDNISMDTIKNFYIPLPPLAEQKRIVAKIEELMPYIERYERAWSKLEELNKRFPIDLQKSILQMAIQGKLVEQRPEEGTAEELYQQIQAEKQRLIKEGKIKKEKPLPEITEDEMPFDIPENWKWVRLSDVVDVRDGTHDTPKYVSKGVPLVTSKNLVNGSIDFETAKLISFEDSVAINMRSAVDDGDILFAMIGTIGNPVLVKKDREFSIKNMALFKKIDETLFDMSYLLFFLQREQDEMKKVANASVQSFVSLSFLRKYLIPLPPLAEQKRIVKKLEEILPLCEKLKK